MRLVQIFVIYKLIPGKLIAIKELENNKCTIQMLQNEVKVLKRLKHANLLQLLAYTEEKKHCCLLYPYMESGNLRKVLEKTSINQNGLSWNVSQKIILGLADGLKYLHHLEYVHLDIKPENVLLDLNEVPKICDFGSIRQSGIRSSLPSCRTFAYQPPEVVSGRTCFG